MIDVVCGVIEDGSGRYLACLRPEGKHLEGLWEFPGGKVEEGESPESALARELLEELAVEVEVGAALESVIWNYELRTIRLLPYRCRIIAGQPQAMEHERIMWCRPEQFEELIWAEADIPILQEIRSVAGAE
jgi:8-oxo-dGTP diphosphatase